MGLVTKQAGRSVRRLGIAISLVVLVGGMVSAQEPVQPSPAPPNVSDAKLAVPKIRVPALPTRMLAPTPAPVTPSTGAAPIVPRSGNSSPMPSPRVPPVTSSTQPAVTSLPVRLPGAGQLAESPSGLPRLSLEAVSVIEGKPVAVINKRRLVPGEMIAGARVIRILEDQVELEYRGRRFAIGF
jgi:hypothetical protein